jgi:hypothetical protein
LGAGKRIVSVVLVLLIVTTPVLLGTGIVLMNYWTPEGPRSTPIFYTYRNASIPAAGTVEYRDTIKYINSPPEGMISRDDGFYIEIVTPKNELMYRETEYFYLSFSYAGSYGVGINYTVYDPSDNPIYAEHVEGTSLNLHSIIAASVEGMYTFRITNVGQFQLNATTMLGYSGVEMTRPYFYAGVVAVVLAAICAVSLAIIATHHGKKTESMEA